MPLYEYQCPNDGVFEQMRKFSDPPLRACPTCGGPIEKLASAPAIQFKGSGWYVTDYARKTGSAGDESSKPPSSSASESKDAGSSSSTTPPKASATSADKASSDKASSDKKSADKK